MFKLANSFNQYMKSWLNKFNDNHTIDQIYEIFDRKLADNMLHRYNTSYSDDEEESEEEIQSKDTKKAIDIIGQISELRNQISELKDEFIK